MAPVDPDFTALLRRVLVSETFISIGGSEVPTVKESIEVLFVYNDANTDARPKWNPELNLPFKINVLASTACAEAAAQLQRKRLCGHGGTDQGPTRFGTDLPSGPVSRRRRNHAFGLRIEYQIFHIYREVNLTPLTGELDAVTGASP